MVSGIVRKQLGLLFMGETRDNLRFLITDMHVKGLSDDVGHEIMTTIA